MLYINPTIEVVTYGRWPGARFLLLEDKVHQGYIARLPIVANIAYPESLHIQVILEVGQPRDLYFAERKDYEDALAQLMRIFRYEDVNHHSETVTSGSFS